MTYSELKSNLMWSDKLAEKRFYDLLKKRDMKAMEFLYDHYSSVIYGLIMHSTRNEESAEKLMVKAFRYIWKNHREFDPDKQHVCVWVINIVRKMCRQEIPFQQFMQNGNPNAVFTSLDKSKLSLGGSPSSIKSKKVFDLLFFGNGTLAEVAKHAGMSEAEIKCALRDAINRLNHAPARVEYNG